MGDINVRRVKEIMLDRGILEREVTDETVYRWLRRGLFDGAYKAIGLPGRPWRIPEDSIEKFVENYS